MSNLRLFAIHVVLYLPLVLLLQYETGVYQSELSHQPDESAHVVMSLLVRDYAITGIGTSPLRFAENYYIHYPKIAFGIWPPFFHAVAGLWILLFTRTQTALLIFIAFQGALCAATLAVFARRLLPGFAAYALGLFAILMPAFQNATSLVMVDLFLTMIELWVMLLMIELFRTGTTKSAVWFGLLTSLAMFTKGNANAMVLAGIFMLLLTRQFSIFRRPPIYISGAIILLLGGPWQVIMLRVYNGTVPMDPLTLGRFWMLFSGYTAMFVQKLSLPLFLFALVGLAAECLPLLTGRLKGDPRAPDVAGAAAALVGIFLFHCVAPNPGPDDRYILPALPLLLLFSALGIRQVASWIRIPSIPIVARAVILAVLCLAWFTKTTFAITQRPELGFSRAAAELLPARIADEVVLVCSDSWGEGALITTFALKDRMDSQHIVLRGSKVLSENPWDTSTYRPFFANTAELETYLEAVPVDALVLDLSRTMWEQDRNLLMQTIHENPGKWTLAWEIPAGAISERHVQLYRWTGPDHSKLRKNVRVRMRLTLGRDLQNK